VIAEMLALAVTAGESPTGAIDRITRLAHGPLVSQLGGVLAETRSGTSFLTALTRLRDRTGIEPLARFLDGMAVAIERGTPLADVLRAQAADVRALGKRQLLESGGRKEIAMMVPVTSEPRYIPRFDPFSQVGGGARRLGSPRRVPKPVTPDR